MSTDLPEILFFSCFHRVLRTEKKTGCGAVREGARAPRAK